MNPISRTLFGLAVVGLASCNSVGGTRSPANDSAIAAQLDELLGVDYSIQSIIQALNIKFSGHGRVLSGEYELRERARFIGLTAKTQSEREEARALAFAVQKIEKLKERASRVQRQVDEDLSKFPDFASPGYASAVRVTPYYALSIGDSTSIPRPIDTLGDIGSGVREICLYNRDVDAKTSGLAFFSSFHSKSLGCAIEPSEVKILDGPIDALNMKIELLTGKPLPRWLYDNVDPNHQVDLSQAPELEMVILSYLEFKHDFSGRMMAQILKHHAARGTQIRILLPGLPVMTFVTSEDKVLFAELLKDSNVQIQYYRYTWDNPDFTTPLKVVQRSFHAKALTVLAKDPEKSGVISGGRNIKDTFYLQKLPNYSKYPEMFQYGTAGRPFGFFRDLEVFARGRAVAEQVASQQMAFWNRDLRGPRMNATSYHVPTGAKLEEMRGKTLVRHIISAPFMDDADMEQLYVGMIDSAKTRIRILNAYVRPTKKLAQAIRNAAIRGVQIQFITGVDFRNDNTMGFTGDMNKLSFNEMRKRNKKDIEDDKMVAAIQLYFWNEVPESIMHSKALMVDDDLLYIGSANMDIRTFRQDIESGFLVTGDQPTDYFRKLYDGFYMKWATPANEEEKTKFLNRFVIRILDALGVS
jgi:phosphatidylserine/phosphatidylglycerophosphate/cardiolipin synthase-like enzyme